MCVLLVLNATVNVFFTTIAISSLFLLDNYVYYWVVYIHIRFFWNTALDFLTLGNYGSEIPQKLYSFLNTICALLFWCGKQWPGRMIGGQAAIQCLTHIHPLYGRVIYEFKAYKNEFRGSIYIYTYVCIICKEYWKIKMILTILRKLRKRTSVNIIWRKLLCRSFKFSS